MWITFINLLEVAGTLACKFLSTTAGLVEIDHAKQVPGNVTGKVMPFWPMFKKLSGCKSFVLSTEGGNRTHTPLTGPRILSPF